MVGTLPADLEKLGAYEIRIVEVKMGAMTYYGCDYWMDHNAPAGSRVPGPYKSRSMILLGVYRRYWDKENIQWDRDGYRWYLASYNTPTAIERHPNSHPWGLCFIMKPWDFEPEKRKVMDMKVSYIG